MLINIEMQVADLSNRQHVYSLKEQFIVKRTQSIPKLEDKGKISAEHFFYTVLKNNDSLTCQKCQNTSDM